MEAPAPALTDHRRRRAMMAVDYHTPNSRSGKSVSGRFWPRVNKDGSIPADRPDLGKCWLWIGRCNDDGYGLISVEYDMQRAHRVSYEMAMGPIPGGFDIDHLCRVRSCVNPAHLEPVTRQTNLLRGFTIPAYHAQKTHCPRGHPYSGCNLYIGKDGSRRCRTCNCEWQRHLRRRRSK